jgi:hypothetical protein
MLVAIPDASTGYQLGSMAARFFYLPAWVFTRASTIGFAWVVESLLGRQRCDARNHHVRCRRHFASTMSSHRRWLNDPERQGPP